jgi:hypothetical protein
LICLTAATVACYELDHPSAVPDKRNKIFWAIEWNLNSQEENLNTTEIFIQLYQVIQS